MPENNTTLVPKNPDVAELFETVIKGGYCIGCGACASISGSPITMQLDKYLKIQAVIDETKIQEDTVTEISLQKVCPFSDKSENEDVIAKRLFGNSNKNYTDKIGYHYSTYAGYVAEGDFRKNGSSGGMGSWISSAVFKKGLIDYVINIQSRQPTPDDKRLFHYQLSSNLDEIAGSSKSRYYPIELSEVVTLIRNIPGRYLIVGIPCFIKSIRLLCNNDAVLNERVKFCLGLICGHLKSTGFAEMMAWQSGITPNELTSINFRTKLTGHGANRYGITVTGNVNNEAVTKVSPPVSELYGTNWGLGFFKYKACDYCDDVVAETADVTIGDAWLPQYLKDSQGTNVIVIRNPVIAQLVEEAHQRNELVLDVIDANEVIKSQSSGLHHRREGLSYRLYLADQKQEWRPKKRVEAKNILDDKNKKKQKLRIEMAEVSHLAFYEATQQNNFQVFKATMEPIVQRYQLLYKKPLWKKAFGFIKRKLVK